LAYVSSHEYAGEMVGYAREYGAKFWPKALSS